MKLFLILAFLSVTFAPLCEGQAPSQIFNGQCGANIAGDKNNVTIYCGSDDTITTATDAQQNSKIKELERRIDDIAAASISKRNSKISELVGTNRLDDAAKILDEAISGKTTPNELADLLFQRANIHTLVGEDNLALEKFEAANALKPKDPVYLGRLGQSLLLVGATERAETILGESVAGLSTVTNAYEATVLYSWVRLALNRDKPSVVEKKLKSVVDELKVAAESDPIRKFWLPIFQGQLATTYRKKNQLLDAKEQFHASTLSFASSAKSGLNPLQAKSIAETYREYGNLLSDENDSSTALFYYQQALPIFSKLSKCDRQEFESDVASLYNEMALVNTHIGNFNEAECLLQRSKSIYENIGKYSPREKTQHVAMVLNNLSNLYQAQKRYKEELKVSQESYDIYYSLNQQFPVSYKADLAMSSMNLAMAYKNNRNLLKAETLLQSSLAQYTDLSKSEPGVHQLDIAMVKHNIGSIFFDLKRFDDAIKYLEESEKIERNNLWNKNNIASDLLAKTLTLKGQIELSKSQSANICGLLTEASKYAKIINTKVYVVETAGQGKCYDLLKKILNSKNPLVSSRLFEESKELPSSKGIIGELLPDKLATPSAGCITHSADPNAAMVFFIGNNPIIFPSDKTQLVALQVNNLDLVTIKREGNKLFFSIFVYVDKFQQIAPLVEDNKVLDYRSSGLDTELSPDKHSVRFLNDGQEMMKIDFLNSSSAQLTGYYFTPRCGLMTIKSDYVQISGHRTAGTCNSNPAEVGMRIFCSSPYTANITFAD